MNDTQYKVMTERLDQIQKVVDRIDRDLNTDRKDIQDMQVRFGSIESEVHQLRDSVMKMPIRVMDRVEDVMEPLAKNIEKKRTILIKAKFNWKSLFRR